MLPKWYFAVFVVDRIPQHFFRDLWEKKFGLLFLYTKGLTASKKKLYFQSALVVTDKPGPTVPMEPKVSKY